MIDRIIWAEGDLNNILTPPFCFEDGKRYLLRIDLKPKNGYIFDYTGYAGVSQFDVFTLNGGQSLLDLISCAVYNKTSCEMTSVLLTPERKCGENVYWYLDESSGELSVYGNGLMWNYSNTTLPPLYTISKYTDLKTAVIENGVTSVGDMFFYGCSNLSRLSFPGSVEAIGDAAFYRCSGLTSVLIPSSVKTVGYQVFGKSGLTRVALLRTNIVIGDEDYDVFNSCPDSLTVYGWSGTAAETFAEKYGCIFIGMVG